MEVSPSRGLVKYAIPFSVHFPTVCCSPLQFISHVLNGSQSAGWDHQCLLGATCLGKQCPSPGRAPGEVAHGTACFLASAASWPSTENNF